MWWSAYVGTVEEEDGNIIMCGDEIVLYNSQSYRRHLDTHYIVPTILYLISYVVRIHSLGVCVVLRGWFDRFFKMVFWRDLVAELHPDENNSFFRVIYTVAP